MYLCLSIFTSTLFLDTLLLWGMYIEYIEEALKFVDRNQLLIVKMEDYHKSKTNTINAVSDLARQLQTQRTIYQIPQNLVRLY